MCLLLCGILKCDRCIPSDFVCTKECVKKFKKLIGIEILIPTLYRFHGAIF